MALWPVSLAMASCWHSGEFSRELMSFIDEPKNMGVADIGRFRTLLAKLDDAERFVLASAAIAAIKDSGRELDYDARYELFKLELDGMERRRARGGASHRGPARQKQRRAPRRERRPRLAGPQAFDNRGRPVESWDHDVWCSAPASSGGVLGFEHRDVGGLLEADRRRRAQARPAGASDHHQRAAAQGGAQATAGRPGGRGAPAGSATHG